MGMPIKQWLPLPQSPTNRLPVSMSLPILDIQSKWTFALPILLQLGANHLFCGSRRLKT